MKMLYNKCREDKTIRRIPDETVQVQAEMRGRETTDFVWLMENFNLDYILMGEYAVSDKDIHIEGTLVRADGEMFFPVSDGRLKDMSIILKRFFENSNKLIK